MNGEPQNAGYRPKGREVPKGTKLADLRKVGGFDLGIYYHLDERHKWRDIETFERVIDAMQRTLRRMKKEVNNCSECEMIIDYCECGVDA